MSPRNFYSQHQNAFLNPNSNPTEKQHHKIATSKRNPFNCIRKEYCRQFVAEQMVMGGEAEAGSDLWIDQLLTFLASRGQPGVTRESVKFWYERHPTEFLFLAGVPNSVEKGRGQRKTRAESGSKSGNEKSYATKTRQKVVDSNANWNFHEAQKTTPQKQPEKQQAFQNVPTSASFPIPMPMPTNVPTSAKSSAPNSNSNLNPGQVLLGQAETEYQQKRKDYNNTFDTIRNLHDIFHRHPDLAECLLHLEKIQTICSRTNSQLVFPTKFKTNSRKEQNAKTGNGKGTTNKMEDASADSDVECLDEEMINLE